MEKDGDTKSENTTEKTDDIPKKVEKMLSPKSLKIKIQKEEMKKNFSLKLKSEVESKK